jgi:hypothetical protein
MIPHHHLPTPDNGTSNPASTVQSQIYPLTGTLSNLDGFLGLLLNDEEGDKEDKEDTRLTEVEKRVAGDDGSANFAMNVDFEYTTHTHSEGNHRSSKQFQPYSSSIASPNTHITANHQASSEPTFTFQSRGVVQSPSTMGFKSTLPHDPHSLLQSKSQGPTFSQTATNVLDAASSLLGDTLYPSSLGFHGREFSARTENLTSRKGNTNEKSSPLHSSTMRDFTAATTPSRKCSFFFMVMLCDDRACRPLRRAPKFFFLFKNCRVD